MKLNGLVRVISFFEDGFTEMKKDNHILQSLCNLNILAEPGCSSVYSN
uniref:Uncharacterized protein n=1 Tax=Anguilla anguilla TaxID=7936 RepID=A0A0E9QL65_ANGAN